MLYNHECHFSFVIPSEEGIQTTLLARGFFYRGGKAWLPRLSPLRTGHADLPHPALRSVVILMRTEARHDGHRKG
jgi:hypothetical protein